MFAVKDTIIIQSLTTSSRKMRDNTVRFIEKPIDTPDFLLTIAELLTEGTVQISEPLGERKFYQGYRERLESKLRQKNTQIARTERLLTTLPPEQRPAFEALLHQCEGERGEIQEELNQIYQILDEFKRKRSHN